MAVGAPDPIFPGLRVRLPGELCPCERCHAQHRRASSPGPPSLACCLCLQAWQVYRRCCQLHDATLQGCGHAALEEAGVQAAAAVETEELVELAPPQPFRFEPEGPQEPIPAERKISRAEEHRLDLAAARIAAFRVWSDLKKDASR